MSSNRIFHGNANVGLSDLDWGEILSLSSGFVNKKSTHRPLTPKAWSLNNEVGSTGTVKKREDFYFFFSSLFMYTCF